MIKLHLGCGKRRAEGYINVDIQPFDSVDLVADITKLPFEKESIDLIYSCANIEHFGRDEYKQVLSHWYSLLKTGGVLEISTLDFAAICRHYSYYRDIKKLIGLTVGGGKDFTDRHGIIFDKYLLEDSLYDVGFSFVNTDINWEYFDVYQTNPGYDDFARSYLPHMDFKNGQLMMLNMRAWK